MQTKKQKKRRISLRFSKDLPFFHAFGVLYFSLNLYLPMPVFVLDGFVVHRTAQTAFNQRYHPGEESSTTQDAVEKEKTRRASNVFLFRASYECFLIAVLPD